MKKIYIKDFCEEIGTRKIEVSVDDIIAFYPEDETKVEEKNYD